MPKGADLIAEQAPDLREVLAQAHEMCWPITPVRAAS
jgi:hypothetical protein